jgi:soluble cytochrome b562
MKANLVDNESIELYGGETFKALKQTNLPFYLTLQEFTNDVLGDYHYAKAIYGDEWVTNDTVDVNDGFAKTIVQNIEKFIKDKGIKDMKSFLEQFDKDSNAFHEAYKKNHPDPSIFVISEVDGKAPEPKDSTFTNKKHPVLGVTAAAYNDSRHFKVGLKRIMENFKDPDYRPQLVATEDLIRSSQKTSLKTPSLKDFSDDEIQKYHLQERIVVKKAAEHLKNRRNKYSESVYNRLKNKFNR